MALRTLLSVPPPVVTVRRPSRRRRGFTLVELLVSMVIGLLLVLFLFQLFNSTVTAWREGENQNDTYREARAAMQLMTRDISQITAALPRNGFVSPTPAASPGATPALAPVLVIDRYYPVADPAPAPEDAINEELYCLTSIPNNGTSSLCAVGYFCMWMPDLVSTSDPLYTQKYARAPHAYALVRQFLGSGGYPAGATPAAGSTPPPGLFERLSAAQGHTPLTFKDLYERARPPTIPSPAPSPPVSIGTPLASFVWDLQFRTVKTSQNTTPSPTPDYPAVAPTISPRNGYPATLPAYVEIRFKALSAGAARQMEGNTSVQRSDWNDSNPAATSSIYQRLILPGSRQFVTRVPIASGSFTSTP